MITSLSNERIMAARKLQRRQQRRRTGMFLIEGPRLVSDAVQSGIEPEQLFYAPELIAQNGDASRLVKQLEAMGVNCLAVTGHVFESIAETEAPQGIVAVVRNPEVAAPEAPTLTLILDGVSTPGNAGTLLRSAEAAGADLVIFGPRSVDAYNDKVVRAGMGAHFRLPIRTFSEWEPVWTAVASITDLYVADAKADLAYSDVDWRRPSALIVGSEAYGPSNDSRSKAASVSIPMRGTAESLNVAMAGAIILFEAARQRQSSV